VKTLTSVCKGDIKVYDALWKMWHPNIYVFSPCSIHLKNNHTMNSWRTANFNVKTKPHYSKLFCRSLIYLVHEANLHWVWNNKFYFCSIKFAANTTFQTVSILKQIHVDHIYFEEKKHFDIWSSLMLTPRYIQDIDIDKVHLFKHFNNSLCLFCI